MSEFQKTRLVILLLYQHPNGLHAAELSKFCNMPDNEIDTILKALKHEGMVVSTMTGALGIIWSGRSL